MTFQPLIRINDSIESLLDDLHRLQFLYEALDPNLRRWFEREALVLRAHYSTLIEGNSLKEDDVDAFVDVQSRELSKGDELEVVNYLNALDWIDECCAEGGEAYDERIIRHLHNLIMYGFDFYTPGEYRKGAVKVRDPFTKEIIFVPPGAGSVPSLMRDLALWTQGVMDETAINPAVVAAVTHLEFVAIHPFNDGNGRTARAFSTLILQGMDYGFENLIVLDRYFGSNVREYSNQISLAAGESYTENKNYADWVEYFLVGVYQEAKLIRERVVRASHERARMSKIVVELGMSSRQADGLTYCSINGKIRPREYQRINNVDKYMTSRDLKELERESLLIASGQTRKRVYVLHPKLSGGDAQGENT